jgi:hypothetical protein
MTWLIPALCIAAPFLVFGVRFLRGWRAERRRKRFREAYFKAKAEARR